VAITSAEDLVEGGVLDEAVLAEVVAAALGRPVRLAAWDAEPVAYATGSPATGALLRVTGATADGRPWSVFLKVLHHVRHWPYLHLLPEEARRPFADFFPWRGELVAWEPHFAGRLPDGLRVPRLYRLVDLGDDRLAVWMEDVRQAPGGWDLATFARAARALGGLAALRSHPDVLAACGYPTGFALRTYATNRVEAAAALLDRDDLWAHPVVAAAVDDRLRADQRRLAERLPTILDRLDTLPQAVPHGDASPQNLLVPADDPGTLVAIDVSFQSPHAVGFDLGQLLVGLVHAGVMPARELAAVHAAIVPAFAGGLRDHGMRVAGDDLARGSAGSLAVRAAFTALPFERLDGPVAEPATPELAAAFRERAALARFITDLGLALA
jgi:hypothetical protein